MVISAQGSAVHKATKCYCCLPQVCGITPFRSKDKSALKRMITQQKLKFTKNADGPPHPPSPPMLTHGRVHTLSMHFRSPSRALKKEATRGHWQCLLRSELHMDSTIRWFAIRRNCRMLNVMLRVFSERTNANWQTRLCRLMCLILKAQGICPRGLSRWSDAAEEGPHEVNHCAASLRPI